MGILCRIIGVIEVSQAEDVVDFADDDAVFAFAEFTFDVQLGQGRAGAIVGVFLYGESFAGQAGEGVDDANVFVGLVGPGGGDVVGGEFVEEVVDLSGGSLETGLRDLEASMFWRRSLAASYLARC